MIIFLANEYCVYTFKDDAGATDQFFYIFWSNRPHDVDRVDEVDDVFVR